MLLDPSVLSRVAMALPLIKSLADCTDFSKTVLPFVGQLYDLPGQLLQSWNNPIELKILYMATNPMVSAFAFSLVVAAVVLVVSEFNRNYSQVDRLWPILPNLYIAHFAIYAHLSGLDTTRLTNLLGCSTLWSVRITPFADCLGSPFPRFG
jgi:hypothetical protein